MTGTDLLKLVTLINFVKIGKLIIIQTTVTCIHKFTKFNCTELRF